MPAAPIVVYGASGYTGRLVVAEARRRGLDLVLSGRDGTKLRALARAGETARAAALDDRDALRHAFAGAAAVINCAGPFTRYGEPVLRAAIDTGVHYVDTTGEQGWIRRVFERHDDAARAAEVAAIPAVGFDYVPGDLICRLVADGLEPLDELVLAYGVQGFGATRGTMHSALEAVRAEGPRRPRRQSFTFPEPLGRQVMADYPCGEVVTVPRHTRVRTLTPLITATASAGQGAPGPGDRPPAGGTLGGGPARRALDHRRGRPRGRRRDPARSRARGRRLRPHRGHGRPQRRAAGRPGL